VRAVAWFTLTSRPSRRSRARQKDKINPHFKSKYADIGSVIDAIKPILAKHDLAFTQHPQPSEQGVIVETVLHHATGETLSMGTLYVPANKQDAQGFGSALTYARRYALMTAFGVPAEDDDGNAAASASARPTTGEIKQAEKDWPELLTGDPKLEGDDEGLKRLVARRREELTPKLESTAFQLLSSLVMECATPGDLNGLLDEYDATVKELDGEEARRFETLFNEREAALRAPTPMTTGAFGG
jgi:hypothetical protein